MAIGDRKRILVLGGGFAGMSQRRTHARHAAASPACSRRRSCNDASDVSPISS